MGWRLVVRDVMAGAGPHIRDPTWITRCCPAAHPWLRRAKLGCAVVKMLICPSGTPLIATLIGPKQKGTLYKQMQNAEFHFGGTWLL